MNTAQSLLLEALFLSAGTGVAQSVDKESVAIVELSGAGGWSVKNDSSNFGADFAVEVTPIENWLELEAGNTPSSAVARPNGIRICCLSEGKRGEQKLKRLELM